jgi:hypothetical protein
MHKEHADRGHHCAGGENNFVVLKLVFISDDSSIASSKKFCRLSLLDQLIASSLILPPENFAKCDFSDFQGG